MVFERRRRGQVRWSEGETHPEPALMPSEGTAPGYGIAGREEIDVYTRTYRSLLKSTGPVQVKSLIEVHMNTDSSLHVAASHPEPDMSAFIYAVLRLPACIDKIKLFILGQSEEVFARRGYTGVNNWQPVSAPGRRRKMFYDGRDRLAIYIASISDVDDLIPIIVGMQIEWNKFYRILNGDPDLLDLLRANADPSIALQLSEDRLRQIADGLMVSVSDLLKLRNIWGGQFLLRILAMSRSKKNMYVQLLAGSYIDYLKATQKWWSHIAAALANLNLAHAPVYFVSSNTHTLVNMLSGFALRERDRLIDFIHQPDQEQLLEEYQRIQNHQVPSSIENFLYYVMKKYIAQDQTDEFLDARTMLEERHGIHTVHSLYYLDIDAQIIDLRQLDPAMFDPRLEMYGLDQLHRSGAIILNVDYPLGFAAYEVLHAVSQHTDQVKGIYVMGKAATLNGKIGDIMIPGSVTDQHSGNTYLFDNAFTADDVAPYLHYGSVLDNQEAATVKGTFLQNRQMLDLYYRSGDTVIEMEAGPYLDAIYEDVYPTRYPLNDNVRLIHLPFDFGLIHYASDTPFSRGKNLGVGSLSYYGMDPTYAAGVAILRRILSQELQDLNVRRNGSSGSAPVHYIDNGRIVAQRPRRRARITWRNK